MVRPASSVSPACDAWTRAIHRVSAWSTGSTVDFEESALVGVRPPPCAAVGRRLCWLGTLQAVDVALELGPGQAAAAPDVDRVQVAGLHEGVDGRAADTQQPGGLLGSEQQRLVGPFRSEPVRFGHRFSSDLVAVRTPTAGAERPWEKAPISAVW